jgi:RNA polymerase sigma factor (sigma-70 family)
MMTERLTDEQRAKVEANLPMVLFMVRKYRAPIGMDAEDWLHECVLQLAKAVRYHDPEKGRLSTIFERLVWIRRNHLNHYAKRGRHGRVYACSVMESQGDWSLLELKSGEHPWEIIDARQMVADAMQICRGHEARCFALLSEGLNQREIAKKLGVSRQRINEVMTTARERVAKAFPSLAVYSQQCSRCHGPAQRYSRGKNIYCTECSRIMRVGRKARNERQRKQRLKASA